MSLASVLELKQELLKEVESLTTKVQWLLDSYIKETEDGSFTFPDGDTWLVRPKKAMK